MKKPFLDLIIVESEGGRFESGHKPIFVFKEIFYRYSYSVGIPESFDSYDADWIGIIYDNEEYDACLLEAIPVMLQQTEADIVSCFKKVTGGNPTIMPRFFRRGIEMIPGTVSPRKRDGLHYDRLLNGFINDCSVDKK